MTVADLSENTSITIAIAVSLMAGAFYAGGTVTELRARITGVESRQVSTDQILAELRDITKDHERRLNVQELQGGQQ